jgi:HupE / UreJ protein
MRCSAKVERVLRRRWGPRVQRTGLQAMLFSVHRVIALVPMLVLSVLLLLAAAPAEAHKASDAYLQIDAGTDRLTVRWDIALRDLDAALDLDTDQDGKLTWAEVRAAQPRIETYALEHLHIGGCPLRAGARALERRNDGAYAVLFLSSACTLSTPPVVDYTLFRDIDPTHRGIARLQRDGQAPTVELLDPTHTVATAAAASTTAGAVSGSGAQPTAGAGSVSGVTAAASPSAVATRLAFLRNGVRHILGGYDHVLFLLCLLLPSVMRRAVPGAASQPVRAATSCRPTARRWIPVDRLRDAVLPVVGIVSAFTLAHSLTLGLAAAKVVSLSPAFIEPAIAVTIILAALDNLIPLVPVPRIVVTFCFGLIHGFGFAGVLSELNLPTAEFAWALLAFNVGLEVGQLLIVVAVTALLFALRRQPGYRRWVLQGGSLLAMAVGAVWLVERTANVSLLPLGGI